MSGERLLTHWKCVTYHVSFLSTKNKIFTLCLSQFILLRTMQGRGNELLLALAGTKKLNVSQDM